MVYELLKCLVYMYVIVSQKDVSTSGASARAVAGSKKWGLIYHS